MLYTVDEISFRDINFFTDYIDKSNSTIDTETIDYTEVKDCMKALYNERNCVSATCDDFLKLPKVDGYVNNVKRVPNSFSNVKDKKDDPYTTMDDCLKVPKD